ncbi:DUF4442 domain-containing protein [Reichenbachiella versicolor]|uniref:DUF4442 domain-containing protein n=1 Tax=Reichenbachiella versicolor TaxID=1821036 RepID=UPI000D6E58F0|nr:DUF4442 domain-containing protein [Reichenbachiella versicolor]
MTMRQLNPKQSAFHRRMINPFIFRSFLLTKIPLGFLCGMKLTHLDTTKSVSTVPFKWLNFNPFKSMYFAVQSMAAEISTGVMAIMASIGYNPSVAVIVTGFKAKFHKQAKDRVFFICEDGEKLFSAVNKAIETKQGIEVTIHTTGRTSDGTIVSEFDFTWSFKERNR